MSLQYKTRGNSEPDGKAWVYFCCHPDEMEAYLDPVAKEILESQNCAVWYDDSGAPLDEKGREALRKMQLVVLAVTEKLLTLPNRTMDEVFPFAMEQHIPVLPIFRQKGLEDLFNAKCGELHCLNAVCGEDPTAIAYGEKLKRFLSCVLIGDDLAEKVRDAFDAYVFLSYRKVDRREAQKLMRLIHQNTLFQDVAIWYDEFLTPGENFNAAIAKAVERSDLFVMAVTEHLLGRNYVSETEYPAANDGKRPILPVRMAPVDEARLRATYNFPPECVVVDASDSNALKAALRQSLQNVISAERQKTPRHSYFMGLAYLSGIDVEVDVPRAEKLLREAAKAGLPEAWDKLADMYYTGTGVERDYNAALELRKKAVELFRRASEATPDDPEMTRFLRDGLGAVAELQRDLGYPCLDTLLDWERVCQRTAERFDETEDKKRLRQCYLTLAQMSRGALELRRPDQGESRYGMALRLSRELAEETGALEDRLWVSACYRAQGEAAYFEKGYDYQEAAALYQKALELDLRLEQETQDISVLRSLTKDYQALGQDLLGDLPPEKHREYCREALEAAIRAAGKTAAVEDRRLVCALRLALAERCEGREAEEQRNLAVEGYTQIAEETGWMEDRLALASAYMELMKYADGNETGREWFDRADRLLEHLARTRKHPRVYAVWMSFCHQAAQWLGDEELDKKGEQLGKHLEREYPQGVQRDWCGIPVKLGHTTAPDPEDQQPAERP